MGRNGWAVRLLAIRSVFSVLWHLLFFPQGGRGLPRRRDAELKHSAQTVLFFENCISLLEVAESSSIQHQSWPWPRSEWMVELICVESGERSLVNRHRAFSFAERV